MRILLAGALLNREMAAILDSPLPEPDMDYGRDPYSE